MIRAGEICIKSQKNGMSVTLKLKDISRQVPKKKLTGIGSSDASSTKLSILLHQNCTGCCSEQGVSTGTVGSEDGKASAAFQAQDLDRPATKVISVMLNDASTV